MTDFLAKFCSVPVKKAWGKKNPLIQNTGGIPLAIHFCKNSIRSSRSFTQEANGFRDGYACGKGHTLGRLACKQGLSRAYK